MEPDPVGEKDTDCKGDRICVEEECVDPPAGSAVTAPTEPRADPHELRYARSAIGQSAGLGGLGWGLGGAGFVSGLAAVGLGIADEDGWQGAAGASILLFGVAVPIAGGSGARARAGLARIGVPSHGAGGRITAWIFYISGMTFAAAAIGLGIADVDGAGETTGAAAIMMLSTSLIIMQVDAGRDRSLLKHSVREFASTATPIRPRIAGVGPWVGRGADGSTRAGVGLSGTW